MDSLDKNGSPEALGGAAGEPLPLDADQAVIDAANAEADADHPTVEADLAELAQVLEAVAEREGQPPAEVLTGLADRLATIAERDDGSFEEAVAELGKVIEELAAREPMLTPEEVASLEQAAELNKALDAYVKKVQKIRGQEVELVGCEHCNGTGFDMTGGQAEPTLLEHPHYRRCEECDGHRFVLTGSRDPDEGKIKCPGCGGLGYKQLLDSSDPRSAVAQNGDGEPVFGIPSWMGDPSVGQPGR